MVGRDVMAKFVRLSESCKHITLMALVTKTLTICVAFALISCTQYLLNSGLNANMAMALCCSTTIGSLQLATYIVLKIRLSINFSTFIVIKCRPNICIGNYACL